ncbi:MAG: cupin domain-containing protein [Acidobacteria bacterium]|nr:cupin domain-containing protein [Acidobacteriota bacterium]
MRRHGLSFLTVTFLVVASCFAQSANQQKSTKDNAQASHVHVTPDQITWGPAPSSLPPGAEVAVLNGDPSKAGAHFHMRAKFPDGYTVPPHWHPTDENLIVLKGNLLIGLGEKLDERQAREMPEGSYGLMPKQVKHFAVAKGETIFDIYGSGPFDLTYVNPTDDPRQQSRK